MTVLGDGMKIARIYLRVSTETQNLERQQKLIDEVKNRGFYIAQIYSEKESGINPDRKELNKLINDIQDGDWVFAESIDRITRLPPLEAEALINKITSKGAKIQVPEIFDFDELKKSIDSSEVKLLAEPLLDAMQQIFLRIALNMAHSDYVQRRKRQRDGIQLAKLQGKYKGRKPNIKLHQAILELRQQGISITQTANILNTSQSTILRVTREARQQHN